MSGLTGLVPPDDPDGRCRDLAQFGTAVRTLPGLGHNAHVESPEAVVRLCIEAM